MITVLNGDCIEQMRTLPAESVQLIVTSPPYWGLRDYQIPPSVWGGDPTCEHEWEDRIKKSGGAYAQGSKKRWQHSADDFTRDDRFLDGHPEIPAGATCAKCDAWRGVFGLEPTPELYLAHSVMIFREAWRVLRKDGTLWVNLGDSYANDTKWGGTTGGKHAVGLHGEPIGRAKRQSGLSGGGLVGIPWRVALALQADGWYLRRDNIWFKPNPMPESVNGWSWQKHRVKVPINEAMQRVQTVKCVDADGAGDMPEMSESEGSVSEGEVSSKRKRPSDRAGSGTKARNQKEAVGIQPFREGHGEDENLRQDGEGKKNSGPDSKTVPSNSEGTGKRQAAGQEAATRSEEIGETEGVSSSLLAQSKGTSDGGEARSEAARVDGERKSSGDNAMEAHPNCQPGQMLLVSQKDEEADCGSRDPALEGGNARSEQCGSGVRAVQLDQAGQNSDAPVTGRVPADWKNRPKGWQAGLGSHDKIADGNYRKNGADAATVATYVDCPGCEKCTPNGGLILRKGNWRCTTSHEYVFQFSKSDSYFCDAEAARERTTGNAHARGNGVNPKAKTPGKNSRIYVDRDVTHAESAKRPRQNESFSAAVCGLASSRNRRSVWTIATAPYREAHFATFPPNLVRPIIAAATPHKSCGKCGAPWAPVIERGEARREQQFACGSDQNGEYHPTGNGKYFDGTRAENARTVKQRILAGMMEKRVISHRPTCRCNAGGVPAVVLDMFGGSGTVGQVAGEVGRDCILIELNPNYIPLIHKRTAAPGLAL